jgi:TatD DNase family protein
MDFAYIDTHGHINDVAFDEDRDDVIKKLKDERVATMIVGTALEMSKKAIELSSREEGRYAIVGEHPYDKYDEPFDVDVYTALAQEERAVAIGECGLDYFWPAAEGWKHGEKEEKERQVLLFEKEITVAQQVSKPLVIHGRPTKGTMDAYEDILAHLKRMIHHAPLSGVAHFFAGDERIARAFLDLGFYCSFTGVLTFTRDYDDIVRYIPKDRILPETDAPYVAPIPYRGKRNEPTYIKEIYKAIAHIRRVDEEEMRVQLNTNAKTLFSL